MKIKCTECQHVSRITHTKPQSESTTDLYCDCGHCGHRFVFTLSFSHTVQPPTFDESRWLLNTVRKLSDDDKKELLGELLGELTK
ncbi:ogr/Delta-like zinc finger family protein [Marinibactrum halimedae]|uniref:ogr/Delta-like zinc finger family protein n=1 Tax=Marinibactrum halimedae TaxID=1444977 RepID=UPI0022B7B853|nr:ogr/Delta-like zinc finger family protein [Marinibactrum halimedae]